MEKISRTRDTWWKKVKRKVNSVWKWIRLPFSIGNWLRRHWKTAVLVGIFVIGLAMMFGGAFRLRGVELVTVLVVAGILMAFAYIKMTFDSAVERARKARESQDLANEKDELAKELEWERSKRVKVLNIEPILEMGILEAECEVTKFFDRYFDKDDKEVGESVLEQKGPGPRKLVKRFLGALTAKFKAMYGIDIQKVQVKCDHQAETFHVANAEPSFRGVRGYPQTGWEGSVGLHRSWGSWVIDEASEKLESACREKYREAVEKSLKNGPEQLEWVKGPLRNTIKRLFQAIAPRGYRVDMVDYPREGFIPLSDYLRGFGLEGPDQLFLPR